MVTVELRLLCEGMEQVVWALGAVDVGRLGKGCSGAGCLGSGNGCRSGHSLGSGARCSVLGHGLGTVARHNWARKWD